MRQLNVDSVPKGASVACFIPAGAVCRCDGCGSERTWRERFSVDRTAASWSTTETVALSDYMRADSKKRGRALAASRSSHGGCVLQRADCAITRKRIASARIDSSCEFMPEAQRTLLEADRRSAPLPHAGFEEILQPSIIIRFMGSGELLNTLEYPTDQLTE